MAELRHGRPMNLEGWMHKESKFFKSKYKRYLQLRGSILSNHSTPDSPATWEVNVIDYPVQPGARQNEIVVTLPGKKVSFFAATRDDFTKWTQALKQASASRVEDFYAFGKMLGEGAFAQVRLGVDRDTGEQFAIKIIKKLQYDKREMDYITREVNIMKSVSHPNVVNTYDVFDTSDRLHIVLEFMEGGELFDIIADNGRFSEKDASQVMRDVVKGVQYLHTHSIVHRDIKPENVLCKTKDWPLQVKLADFGLANFAEDGTIKESADGCMVGTPGYVAPEVVKKEEYGPEVDLWSCGVLLYIMLSGKMPFYGRNDAECLARIRDGVYSFPDREWCNISDGAKSLVKALLQMSPEKRLTARAALQHKWLADPLELSEAPIPNDLSGIHSTRRKLLRAVNVARSINRMKDAALIQANNPNTSQGSGPNTSQGS